MTSCLFSWIMKLFLKGVSSLINSFLSEITCIENGDKSKTCRIVFPESVSIHLTVKILKIGTPEIITIIVLQLEQLDFTVQYCVQKMQTE